MSAAGGDSLVPVPQCLRDTQTIRYQLDGAEMSSPKCPVLSKVDDFATFKKVEVV